MPEEPKKELVKEFDFPLTTSIEYSHEGQQKEAEFIRLTAPTSRNSDECAFLKQAFWRSADRETSGGKVDDDKEVDIKGQDVLIMMAMSEKVDLREVVQVAKHLFTKGKVATLDGEVPLTKPRIDEMSEDDVEAMLGEYLVNFTLASSLAQIKKDSAKST